MANEPLFCDRCLCELRRGCGEFYEVRIEAVADPTPPELNLPTAGAPLRQAIADTVEQLNNLSAQEALDQVLRRLTITLCLSCYQRWIENPAGE